MEKVHTGQQGSGVLRSMSEANCFIGLEHGRGSVKAGEQVDVQLLKASLDAHRPEFPCAEGHAREIQGAIRAIARDAARAALRCHAGDPARLAAGFRADLVVLTAEAMEELRKSGHVTRVRALGGARA